MVNNMAKQTIIYRVDKDAITEMMEDTDENVEYFNNVAKETADKYTKHLDELMQTLYRVIKKPEFGVEIPAKDLEHYYLELTNLIYFMGNKLEQLSIYGDMARSAEKEVYNKAYLHNQIKDSEKKNKTTVAENQAVAEQESQYESVVALIYEHAYKIVKFKVDAAKDMVGTLRKVISRRMQEEQLSSFNSGKVTAVYNEDE